MVQATDIKARYNPVQCFFLFMCTLCAILLIVITPIAMITSGDGSASDIFSALGGSLVFVIIAAAFLLPIILKTPKEEMAGTIGRAFLLGLKAYFKFAFCVFIFGFFINMRAKCNLKDYTAYVDGKKVPVTLTDENTAIGRDGTSYMIY